MGAVADVVALIVAAFASATTSLGMREAPTSELVWAKVGSAATALSQAFRAEDIAPPEPVMRLEKSRQMIIKGGVLRLPRGFRTVNGRFDLLVHFHGSPDVLGPAMEKLDMGAALLTVNLGIGSAAYEWPYIYEGALPAMIANVEAAVRDTKIAGASPEPRVQRVGLSSWSAGYGAVYRIIAQPTAAARIDAILLEDSLHAAYKTRKTREIDDVKMGPFVEFAATAMAGKKLFVMTHSAVPTDGFASTSETALYLTDALGLEVQPADAIRGKGMHEVGRVARGSFALTAFTGHNEAAHCDHLLQVGETLLLRLATRWRKPGPRP